MKIKYTQRKMEADADTDLALAMAMEEEAGHDNSDDDFQVTGSSPALTIQTLALRNCSMKKAIKKRVSKSKDTATPSYRSVGNNENSSNQKENRSDGGKKKKMGGKSTRVNSERKFEGKGRKLSDFEARRVLSDHNARLGPTGTSGHVENCRVSTDCSERAKEIDVKGRAERNNSVINDDVVMHTLIAEPIHGSECSLAESERIWNDEFRSIGSIQCETTDVNNRVDPEETELLVVESLADPWKELGVEETERINGSQIVGGQSDEHVPISSMLRLESKRRLRLTNRDAEWSLQGDGVKKVKRPSGAESDENIAVLGEPEVIAERDSLACECVQHDDEDEGDEGLVICTQVEAATGKKPQILESMGVGAANHLGKSGLVERKHNIYDILLGNMRTQVHVKASDSALYTEIECDNEVGEEEMENPGTAMRALVDEAELDYQGLGFSDQEKTESVDSFECPICGLDVVSLSVADREQHINDCLEKCETLRDPTNPGDNPQIADCVAESTSKCEGSQLLGSKDDAQIGTLGCPICGIDIHELSTSERELHTNACLDNVKEEELGEVSHLVHLDVTHVPGRPEMGPVLEWLEKLNLGKYVEIFMKEEIDWDTLQLLTEEDLNSLGITALGPRRKIVCAIQELKKETSGSLQGQGRSRVQEEGQVSSNPVARTSKVPTAAFEINPGTNKSITDFFILPPNTRQRQPASDHGLPAAPKVPRTGGSVKKRIQRMPVVCGGNARSNRESTIPPWMCIPGTSFRVDAFKHLTIDCSNWFLTHFHTDHYQGLTRGFRHGKIYCSSITASLVSLHIGVHLDRLQIIPLNETVLIEGVRVTFIDANHCPGSVMILFEPPNGKAVLHTGDFRFCSDMTTNEALRACQITTLILDTTYCDPQYDFPKQDIVVQFVIDAIQAEAFNPKTLFLIGTYTIGKERIFLEVGKVLQKYIYVGAAKRRLLDCMDLAEEDKKWLTSHDHESHIHVVPLWSIASFKRMGSISRHYHGQYNSIVGFSPTGWSFGRDKKRSPGRPGRRYQQGAIIRYEVPYSEHCSFTELKEFVHTIAPNNIIPSVISSTGQTADALVAGLLSEES